MGMCEFLIFPEDFSCQLKLVSQMNKNSQFRICVHRRTHILVFSREGIDHFKPDSRLTTGLVLLCMFGIQVMRTDVNESHL